MMYALIIAAFVLLHAHDYVGAVLLEGWMPGRVVLALTLIPMFAAWLAGHAIIAACGRELDRSGRLTAVRQAERTLAVTRVVGLGLFAVDVLVLGWVETARDALGPFAFVQDVLVLSPLIALIVAGWWSIEPIERRLREAMLLRDLEQGHPVHTPFTRGQFVWNSVRHQLLLVLGPVLIISLWSEGLDRVAHAMGYTGDEPGAALHGTVLGLVQLAGIVVLVALMPLALRVLWSTTPLGPGELRSRLMDVCTRTGVRVRELLVWNTRGQLFNAAVMGLVAPVRYILVTDALLERLPGRQLEAVAAHEAGHVRHHHLVWLALCTMAATGLTASASWAAAQLMGPAADRDSDGSVAASMGELGVSSLGVVIGLLAFGWISRRFEWQADAFAAADLSRHPAPGEPSPDGAGDAPGCITAEAVTAMVGALASVATLNGIDPWRFTFRHGSIVERQRRLRALMGLPLASLPIDRACQRLKGAGILGLALLVGLAVWHGVS